jgi:hypothetical protein
MQADVKARGVSGDSNSNDSSAGASTVMEVQREIIRELNSHAARKEKVRGLFLVHRSHSISFTRAQGIPKYKIGFGRGKGW